jgi:hypothetical protein
MFRAVPVVTAALLAAIILPGCATPGSPLSPRPVVRRPVPLQAGAVKVSFPGLQPATAVYKTMATRNDIDTVTISLQSPTGVQVRRLTRRQLMVPVVVVQFDKVPTGWFTFSVEAYDNTGRSIGQGIEKGQVKANQTTQMNMSVQLESDDATGDVAAVIDFIDGQPSVPCGAEAFYAADANGDAQLSIREFAAQFPYCGGGQIQPPAPPIVEHPIGRVSPVVATPAPVAAPEKANDTAYTLQMSPVYHDAHQTFAWLDSNHNGYLSLREFLAEPKPEDPCGVAFSNLDLNDDGVLQFPEWLNGQPRVMPVPCLPLATPERDTLKVELSRPILPEDTWLRREFVRADLNGNGVLEREEYCEESFCTLPAMPGLVPGDDVSVLAAPTLN